MKQVILSVVVLACVVDGSFAQTTSAGGNWATSGIWSGGSVPSGWTTINIGHTVAKSSGQNVEGTLNVNAAGVLSITGNVTITGGSVINVYGNLVINGDLRLYGYLNIYPGATVRVNGSTYIESSPYLVIGTSTGGPPYADLIVTQNLVSPSGGDVTVRRNGRLAVFGNFSGSSGGDTNIIMDDGGQAYIQGTIAFTGGGDNLTNNNDGIPYYGFYSPNQPTYNGGGSGSNGTAGSNSVQGVSQIPPEFKTWLSSIPGSPLPVKLLYFNVVTVGERGISLEWATSMEKNFSYFEIETAGSDLEFSAIAIVQGHGGLEVKTIYSILDDSPANGMNYYRLKAVDLDNTSEYFNVIVANWNGASSGATLYPNPAIDHSFTIAIGDAYYQPTIIEVYEPTGYMVYTTKLDVNVTTVTLPVSVASGIYFVKVVSTSKQELIRLFVE